MRSTLSRWLILALVLVLTGCGAPAGPGSTGTGGAGSDGDPSPAAAPETPAQPGDSEPAGSETPEEPDSDAREILIAYFSATNHTENIANHLNDILDADLYEIVPEIPYTADDLNYNDSSSRSSQEMNDPDARPAISGSVDNMEQYDVLLLGYPIWWGEAPRIISTFLESYDFSGKTIVPFCTSGSSGIGSSALNLQDLTGSAVWLDGQRFSGGAPRSAVETWVNSMPLTLSPAA